MRVCACSLALSCSVPDVFVLLHSWMCCVDCDSGNHPDEEQAGREASQCTGLPCGLWRAVRSCPLVPGHGVGYTLALSSSDSCFPHTLGLTRAYVCRTASLCSSLSLSLHICTCDYCSTSQHWALKQTVSLVKTLNTSPGPYWAFSAILMNE